MVERAAEIKLEKPDEEKRTAVEAKIFGRHENILNILCGFLREHTNNPEYLAQNYPSLTKEYLFTHSDEVLKEAALLGKDEKPSNLIQETFNLLFQKRGSEINEKSTITFLNYKADLRGFIFRGGRLDNGCMNNVSLMNTDFSYCQINSSDMDVDSCKNITFFNTTLVNTQLRVSKDEPYSILIFINCELENPSFILPNGSLYLIFTSCVNFRPEQFKTNKLTIVDDLPMVYDFNEEQDYIRATTDHKEGDQYYYRGAFKYTFIRRELQREDIRNSAPLSKESLILIARFLWRDWEVLNSTKYQELSSLLVEEDHNVLEKNFIEYNRKGILDRRNDSEIDSPITHQNLKIDAQARACVYKFLLENGETIESLQSPQSAHSQEATTLQES